MKSTRNSAPLDDQDEGKVGNHSGFVRRWTLPVLVLDVAAAVVALVFVLLRRALVKVVRFFINAAACRNGVFNINIGQDFFRFLFYELGMSLSLRRDVPMVMKLIVLINKW